jgi:hypothetical protein
MWPWPLDLLRRLIDPWRCSLLGFCRYAGKRAKDELQSLHYSVELRVI